MSMCLGRTKARTTAESHQVCQVLMHHLTHLHLHLPACLRLQGAPGPSETLQVVASELWWTKRRLCHSIHGHRRLQRSDNTGSCWCLGARWSCLGLLYEGCLAWSPLGLQMHTLSPRFVWCTEAILRTEQAVWYLIEVHGASFDFFDSSSGSRSFQLEAVSECFVLGPILTVMGFGEHHRPCLSLASFYHYFGSFPDGRTTCL